MASSPSDTQSRQFVGAMTGTSMDGLDLALLTVRSNPSTAPELVIEHGQTFDLPGPLRQQLAALATSGEAEIERLGRADRVLGCFIGQTILDYLAARAIDPSAITAVGSHGQTIRHRPDIESPFTLQIGDPNCIAEVSGICTVADFRRRDVAAGGQGAPLVPLFHESLFASLFAHIGSGMEANQAAPAILNIGGISNLTLHTKAGTTGFDTGPGNGLMDEWVTRHKGTPFDADGAWAASARVDEQLLNALLSDPFFGQPPPKSTGREHFCMAWLTGHARLAGLDPAVVQATLTELTARSIAQALLEHAPRTALTLVCGGGRHNRHLMNRLSELAGHQVEPTDAHGIDGDSLEAAAFAWLAYRTLDALPGNAPAVTGASGARVLGGIYPGRQTLVLPGSETNA